MEIPFEQFDLVDTEIPWIVMNLFRAVLVIWLYWINRIWINWIWIYWLCGLIVWINLSLMRMMMMMVVVVMMRIRRRRRRRIGIWSRRGRFRRFSVGLEVLICVRIIPIGLVLFSGVISGVISGIISGVIILFPPLFHSGPSGPVFDRNNFSRGISDYAT